MSDEFETDLEQLTDADYAPADGLEDLPEADLPDDYRAENPSDPDADDHAQDDLAEGLGAGPSAADLQTAPRAVSRVLDKIRAGASNAIGYCLREIRTVNDVGPLYASALESMQAIPPRALHRISDWDQVPRGTIGYFDRPDTRYGHIVENLGGGWIGTTDWPTGKWGRVEGARLAAAWGYTAAYWSPIVNDVRVWWPAAQRKPPPPPTFAEQYPAVADTISRLARLRAAKLKDDKRAEAAAITRAIAELREVDPRNR